MYIFEFDPTFQMKFKNVMKQFDDSFHKKHKIMMLDGKYAIRNYREKEFLLTPRYYDRTDNTMKGFYIIHFGFDGNALPIGAPL